MYTTSKKTVLRKSLRRKIIEHRSNWPWVVFDWLITRITRLFFSFFVTGSMNQDTMEPRDFSQMYYWEVNWPRFFSNRDYVCSRRSKVFKDKEGNDDVIVIFSKSAEHSNYPKKAKAVRVENYWAVMTIKPFTSADQPGIEFSLTAFENPGLSLPSSITTWVAIRGMPDFMSNLRKACLERRKWLKNPATSSSKSNSKEPTYLETPKHYHENSNNANYA